MWHLSTCYIWIPRHLVYDTEIRRGQVINISCRTATTKEAMNPDDSGNCHFVAYKVLAPPIDCPYFQEQSQYTDVWCVRNVPGIILAVHESTAFIWSKFLGKVGLHEAVLSSKVIRKKLSPLLMCRFDAFLDPRPNNDGFQCVDIKFENFCTEQQLNQAGLQTTLGTFTVPSYMPGFDNAAKANWHRPSKTETRLNFIAHQTPPFLSYFSPLDFTGTPVPSAQIKKYVIHKLVKHPSTIYQAILAPNKLGFAMKYRTMLVQELDSGTWSKKHALFATSPTLQNMNPIQQIGPFQLYPTINQLEQPTVTNTLNATENHDLAIKAEVVHTNIAFSALAAEEGFTPFPSLTNPYELRQTDKETLQSSLQPFNTKLDQSIIAIDDHIDRLVRYFQCLALAQDLEYRQAKMAQITLPPLAPTPLQASTAFNPCEMPMTSCPQEQSPGSIARSRLAQALIPPLPSVLPLPGPFSPLDLSNLNPEPMRYGPNVVDRPRCPHTFAQTIEGMSYQHAFPPQ
jgi:hypothetical protein